MRFILHVVAGLLLSVIFAQSAHAQIDPNVEVRSDVESAFADIPVMISIARCESEFRQFDDVGAPLYGGDGSMIGIFQISAGTHAEVARQLGMNISTIAGNLAYARHLYEAEGTVPWLASSACWKTARTRLRVHTLETSVDIRMVQRALNEQGFLIATHGVGSPGKETGYFGTRTRAAVRKFQCANHIVCSGTPHTTGFGVLGARTRAVLFNP